MLAQPNHKHVFLPEEIQVLHASLAQAVKLLVREYGFRGKALASAKMIAAEAIFRAVQQPSYDLLEIADSDSLQLADIGFEGVRQCLVAHRGLKSTWVADPAYSETLQVQELRQAA